QVSCTSAKLQHATTNKRCNSVKHPTIETPGKRYRVKDLLARILINILGQTMSDNLEHRVESVNQSDFLPFLIRPSTVTDRHFVNSGAPFSQFNCQFRLKSEPVACQRNALKQ